MYIFSGAFLMFRTQIYLTDNEREKLGILAHDMGTSQSAVIREAIDQFIARKLMQQQDRNAALQAAKGLWAQRQDLPDFAKLRKEYSNRVNQDENDDK